MVLAGAVEVYPLRDYGLQFEVPVGEDLASDQMFEYVSLIVMAASDGTDIQILRGRYGPYITDGKKNARIPKGAEPESLELDECKALIEAAPARRARKTKKKTSKKKATKKTVASH